MEMPDYFRAKPTSVLAFVFEGERKNLWTDISGKEVEAA